MNFTRAVPVVISVPVQWRSQQFGSDCATLLRRCPPMMNKIPFADPLPVRDDQRGVPKPFEPLAITRKAAFQWHPDCLWPFNDRGSEGDK
jgi:hypothetical protein